MPLFHLAAMLWLVAIKLDSDEGLLSEPIRQRGFLSERI